MGVEFLLFFMSIRLLLLPPLFFVMAVVTLLIIIKIISVTVLNVRYIKCNLNEGRILMVYLRV